MTDTIYDDLKEQGLILSEPALVHFPAIRPPKSTYVGKLASLIKSNPKFNDGVFKLVIIPVLSSTILIGRANTLLCYKYQIDKETQKPIFHQPKIQNLPYKILNIHICDNKFLNDRGEVPFIIESPNELILFHLDLKEYKITCKSSMTYSSIYSLRFVSEKQLILLTSSLQIHHISIQGGLMRLKNNVIPAQLNISTTQMIVSCKIVGNIDEESDSVVILFYLLREKDNQNSQILKVKEYLRNFQGKISVLKQDYTILTNSHSNVLPPQINIESIHNYYCIQTKTEILILKKKFQKYLFIDNVMSKISGNTLKLHQNAIVSSHNQEFMELSIIHFGDPKCSSRILDSIDLVNDIANGFKMAWCFKNQKQTCLMLVFQKDKSLQFYNIIKMDPMRKMLDVVKKVNKDKIGVVQQLAVNLGINKKQFYLTLWSNSKKELADIYQFLLPCLDISSIKKQIRLTMRRKKIQAPEFVKILQKIAGIIKNQLKSNLSQQMLKEYIKNDFLLRKIKLKQKDKKLDHRDFDKVYNSSLIDIFVEIVRNQLFPVEKKLDPLHAMVQQPQTQEMDLRHVFQQFRIMILENYKNFLVSFLSNFKANEIYQVIEKNSFLLPLHVPFILNMTFYEPEYMTQVQLNNTLQKGNGQSQIFSDMTAIEFGRELSKERIEKELHQYYPTSKITEAINTLMNSPYGATQKLRKHGLISCTIYEYQNKLKDIYDIKLFLKVCQFANEYDLYAKQSDGKEDLSQRLVQVFKKENKLNGQAYNTVKLYATMHRFMLKNNFCEKRSKGFTTQELIQFTSQDLIALFFLQNKQRKQFIFNEFRNLYVNLYKRPNQFNEVIRKFINSQNCSRIQLQIFIKQVLQKGNEFQSQNQQLIQLLIDGFCQKLQIRQDNDTKHFLQLMNQVQLGKHLGMKINKIMQIRSCLHVLNIFNCQKLTYYQMLAMQEKNKIFKELLDKYFNQDLKKEVVRLENQEIELNYCRNMLTILIYIQETIYYDVTSEEVVMTYGQTLIEWRQFAVIKSLVYQEDILPKLGIDPIEYVDKLINNVLYALYSDESIPFQEQNQRHIRQILDIYHENSHNIIQIQELAKLEIGRILKEWGMNDLVLFAIQEICQLWQAGEYRRQLIEELLDRYEQNITFKSFEDFYNNLERSTFSPEKQTDQVQINYVEYIGFLLIFADRLLGLGKYAQIIEIFAFVKMIKQIEIDYLLISETFLKSASLLYSDEELLLQGKELIQYFTQNIMNDEALRLLFQTNLQSGKFQNQKQKETTILVDTNFTFKKHHVQIGLDLLWRIVQTEVRQRFASKSYAQKSQTEIKKPKKSAVEQIYYGYYFLIMVFRSPVNSLLRLAKISYNLDLITSLLFRLENEIDQDSSLFAINTFALIKKFRTGLYKLAFKKRTDVQIRQEQAQYQMIKNYLKENKSDNKELLDCIARVDAYVLANKGSKKNQKQIRYEKSKLVAEQNKPKEAQPQPEPQIEVNNATINLKLLLQRKVEISHQSIDVLSQKDILEQIYQNIFQEKKQSRQKNRNLLGNNNILNLNIFTNKKKQVIISEIVQKIYAQQYEQLVEKKMYEKEDITLAAKQVYEDPSKDFHELVHILDVLQIADPQRITIGRACKYYQGVILVQDLKHIFQFQFFIERKTKNEADWKESAYQAIRKNIQNIVITRDNIYMKSMALFIGSILQSNQYFYKFYVDTLDSIGRNYSFTPEAVIRIKILFTNLSEAPELLLENTSRLMASYRDNPDLKKIIKQELELVFSRHYSNDENLFQYIAES